MALDDATVTALRFLGAGALLAYALWKNYRNRRYIPQRLEELARHLNGRVVKGLLRSHAEGVFNGRSVRVRWPVVWLSYTQRMVVEIEVSPHIRGRVRRGRHLEDDLRRLGATEQAMSWPTSAVYLKSFREARGEAMTIRDGWARAPERWPWDEAWLEETRVTFAVALVDGVVRMFDPRSPTGTRAIASNFRLKSMTPPP